MMEKKKKIGYLLTVFGAFCWACSGASGQYLFANRGLDASWLVPVRLTIAGLLLVLYSLGRWRGKVLEIFTSRRNVIDLVIFAIFGMAMCQFSYFTSIELSNAATATTLQFTGPAIVLIWLAVQDRRMPSKKEIAAVLLAIFGAFLLATHGDPTQLAITPKALFWCMVCAAAVAIYNVQPNRIIAEYGTLPITGFGMLLGGLGLDVIFRPWHVVGTWDIVTFGGMTYIILFGTICAFCCYLEGVRRIGAAKGSILSAVEPVASAFLSVFWLKVPLKGIDFGGILLIIAAIILLSGDDSGNEAEKQKNHMKNAAIGQK